MNYYTDVLKKYADFNGRAGRAEYWMFVLLQILIITGVALIDAALRTGFILTGLYLAATFIPTLAVTARRLHDTDRSGWFMLVNLIPFGSIFLLFFCLNDSQPGTNQYGPNPNGLQVF